MPNEGKSEASPWNVPDPRPDLALPKRKGDMVERLRPYGQEESFSANVVLFTHGERGADMFVVLDGQIDMSLPAASGESKIIAHHQRFDFSGELNLLNSQGSLVEARTVGESRLLRIPRSAGCSDSRAQRVISRI